MTSADEVALLDEYAGLVADLRAELEWRTRCGGWAAPRDGLASDHPDAQVGQRGAPAEMNRSRAGADAQPGRVAGAQAPTAPPAPTQKQPAAEEPRGQVALGGWSRFAQASASRAEPTPSESGLREAETMVQVRQVLGDCQRCGLCRERQQLVFGAGDPRSRLMVVGEAPGFHEDREGVPFVGRAGQMLERMLSNVLGLGREQVFITNVVKCRPPENRNPTPHEIGRCLNFHPAVNKHTNEVMVSRC